MTQRVVVVGNGLIGSAAARWLTEFGAEVVVVGPSEPVDHSTHQGVFSSHYDEGRLVSVYGSDATWSEIARQAIGEFAGLERRSGVPFHHPVGRLSVAAAEGHESVLSRAERNDPAGGDLRVWSPADTSWRERFPYLDVPDDMSLLYEGPPAGLVNPRSMLRAQNLVAQQARCSIRRRSCDLGAAETGRRVDVDRGGERSTPTGSSWPRERSPTSPIWCRSPFRSD